jgi:hypothetical protein
LLLVFAACGGQVAQGDSNSLQTAQDYAQNAVMMARKTTTSKKRRIEAAESPLEAFSLA